MATESLALADLPVEVLEHIFSYLPLSERKNASLVCHLWNEVVFSRRFLRNVALSLIMEWDLHGLDCLRNSSRRYRKVFAFFGHETFCDFEFGLVLEVLNKFGAELESFHSMSFFTEKQLWQLLVLAPNLKQLIVGLNSSSIKQQLNFPTLSHLEDLGSLKNVLQIQSLHAPNLTQLSANFTKASDAKGSFAFLQKVSSQLKNLELFSKEYYMEIHELQFPKLEVLSLAGQICAASDGALRSFFSGFRYLKEVKLDFNVQGLVLDVLTAACPAIEKLHFKNHLLESDHFRLLERLQHLKTLSVTGSIHFRINMNCKPLVSVKRFCIQLFDVYDEASICEDFRKLLPNVDDITVTVTEYTRPEWLLVLVCLHYPRLTRLAIVDATSKYLVLSCVIFQALQQLHQLEELTLRSIHTPVAFMVRNNSLKRLKIMYFHWFTDADLLMLADLYPNLKYLELSWCRKLTSWGVEEFRSRRKNCTVHCAQFRC